MFINKSSHKLIARIIINKMRNTLSVIQGFILYIFYIYFIYILYIFYIYFIYILYFFLLFSSHGYIVALFSYLNLEIEAKKLQQIVLSISQPIHALIL